MKRKRKHKKKQKVIIISLVSITSLLAVGYAAFSTTLTLTAKGNIYDKGELCYETSDNGDGTVTITNYDASCGTDVKIPSKIKGKTVTKIGDTTYGSQLSFSKKGITSVEIPDTVVYIGTFAFANNKINKLDLGNGIIEINHEAFHDNQLETLTFPKSLKRIKSGVFINNNLVSIPPLDNIIYDDGAFTYYIYQKNEDGTIDTTILSSYAGGKPQVSTITLPDNIKVLTYYSLRWISPTTLQLPKGIERINNYAIMQSTANTIEISSSIKEIFPNAFSQSVGIKNININRKSNAISGSPWGATNATVNWTGTN